MTEKFRSNNFASIKSIKKKERKKLASTQDSTHPEIK